MIKVGKVIFLTIIGIGFLFGDIPNASAQETSNEEFTLEEITVTAQKREENQQKVAIAMDIITSEEIKELGKNDIDEILSGISSALIQKAGDGYRVTLRGVTDDSGTKLGQSTAMPTVAINTDSVMSNRKDNASGLYDIERVEVLYGPQSTIYSSNSPGGIINIVTSQPKTDKFEAYGSVEVGNYSLIHTEGAVNAPLTDKTAIRASFSTSKRDGYLTNNSDNEDTKSGRLKALYQPNDKLSFILTGEISNNKGAGFGGGVDAFENQDETDNPWSGAENESLAENDQTSKKLYGQMNWDTSLGGLSVIPSYSTREGNSEMIMQGNANYNTQDATEKGLEIRMTSPSDLLFKWIIGATYYNLTDHVLGADETYLETGSGNMTDRDMTEKLRAIFANVTYPITDKFRLTVGYRQSWDKLHLDNNEYKQSMAVPGTYEFSYEYYDQSAEGKPDFKLGYEYDLSENSMFYGDYSTSYRVQGMVKVKNNEPTELHAYSLGSKNRFFGNKIQLNASAYYYDYTNYQSPNRYPVWLFDLDDDLTNRGDEGESAMEPNADAIGDGRMYGFEVQTSTIITPQDMLTLSLSYMKSEWTDLFMDYYYNYTLEVINGTAVPVDVPDENYNGKPMMNTSPLTLNLSYNHSFYLPNGGALKAGITSKYKRGYRLSWKDSEYPLNYQESFHKEDINAVYSNSTGKWSLSAYVTNIFNYAEKTNYISGANIMEIGNPRTFGSVLSVKF